MEELIKALVALNKQLDVANKNARLAVEALEKIDWKFVISCVKDSQNLCSVEGCTNIAFTIRKDKLLCLDHSQS